MDAKWKTGGKSSLPFGMILIFVRPCQHSPDGSVEHLIRRLWVRVPVAECYVLYDMKMPPTSGSSRGITSWLLRFGTGLSLNVLTDMRFRILTEAGNLGFHERTINCLLVSV